MNRPLLYGSIALGAVIMGTCAYGLYSYKRTIANLKSSVSSLSSELSENKVAYDTASKELSDRIAELELSSGSLSAKLTAEQEKNSAVAAKVGTVSTTLSALEKLSRTDPELLKKYSKVYFLNEHYVPISLSKIDPKYLYEPARGLEIHSSIKPRLEAMIADANASGLSLLVDSAYRSFGTQAVLKASYRLTYGAGTANSFSAEQGYSEHQLGTTIDFTTTKLGGGLGGFDKTPESAWLLANAYKYGFVISYPENNTAYQYEPWHWRYVGIRLATDLHARGMQFYDMDQREIDSYLGSIFD